MSTAPLNDLQQQVAEALASGKSPVDVRDSFALTSSTFEAWRQNDAFIAEVSRLRAERQAETTKAAETAETDAFDATTTEAFQR